MIAIEPSGNGIRAVCPLNGLMVEYSLQLMDDTHQSFLHENCTWWCPLNLLVVLYRGRTRYGIPFASETQVLTIVWPQIVLASCIVGVPDI